MCNSACNNQNYEKCCLEKISKVAFVPQQCKSVLMLSKFLLTFRHETSSKATSRTVLSGMEGNPLLLQSEERYLRKACIVKWLTYLELKAQSYARYYLRSRTKSVSDTIFWFKAARRFFYFIYQADVTQVGHTQT